MVQEQGRGGPWWWEERLQPGRQSLKLWSLIRKTVCRWPGGGRGLAGRGRTLTLLCSPCAVPALPHSSTDRKTVEGHLVRSGSVGFKPLSKELPPWGPGMLSSKAAPLPSMLNIAHPGRGPHSEESFRCLKSKFGSSLTLFQFSLKLQLDPREGR